MFICLTLSPSLLSLSSLYSSVSHSLPLSLFLSLSLMGIQLNFAHCDVGGDELGETVAANQTVGAKWRNGDDSPDDDNVDGFKMQNEGSKKLGSSKW